MKLLRAVVLFVLVGLLLGLQGLSAAGIAFDPGKTYASGTFPNGMCSADFNKDGTLDLACSNRWVDSLTILYNSGGGVFDSSIRYQLPMGTNPCAADLNGDSWPDLVIPDYYGMSLNVLINNLDGTFGPATTYPVDGISPACFASDLNGDTKSDLIAIIMTGGTNDHVSVMINKGDGTFDPPVAYSVSGDPAVVGCLADFNGDGNSDIAVTGMGSTVQVQILLGKGDGTFETAAQYGSLVDGDCITAGDFNGDGKPDLAVGTYSDDGDISVLLNNGDGTFAPADHYAAGKNVAGICTEDFDGDGWLDLAISCNTRSLVRLYQNDGTGHFSLAADLGGACYPEAILTTNLDGDTRPDLIATELLADCIHVFMNSVIFDADHDAIPDSLDNCPRTYNPDQQDINQNGIGTACDSSESTFLLKSATEATRKTAIMLRAGSEVDISCNGIKMHFQNVLDDGVLDADTSNIGQLPPTDMLPVWYSVATSARFQNSVTVQITYDPAGNDPNKVRLLHFSGNPPTWRDVTSSNDPVAHKISGTVSSLSQFLLALSGMNLCGDANGDATVDISDAVYLIAYIFSGGPAPQPLIAGDANCDSIVDISDAVYLIAYIFSGGAAPCAVCK